MVGGRDHLGSKEASDAGHISIFGALYYHQPYFTLQPFPISPPLPMQIAVKASLSHVFVHQQCFPPLTAPAFQIQEVVVVNFAHYLHLLHKILYIHSIFYLLYGYCGAISQNVLIDHAGGPLPYAILRTNCVDICTVYEQTHKGARTLSKLTEPLS
ncbi:hypothetical protein GOP47_0017236 [Adiantum capillus-veneris]|uniref:Uncharacterized protein n=1 Tax=Adiantum capillus-veneris TaxID=13818 RepID=A0A9D4ZDS0_ADICA|nr:hypothetical protein GOP47_0017236 [Adiantum capillus-veneris]